MTYLVNGKPSIRDVAVADAEWAAATRPRVDALAGDKAADDTPTVDAPAVDVPVASVVETPAVAAPPTPEIPNYHKSRARREHALAQIAEVEARKVTGGEWIPKADYHALEQAVDAYFRHCSRWLMQRVPGAIHRVFPSATRADRIATEELMRTLLTELSEIAPSKFLDPGTSPVV